MLSEPDLVKSRDVLHACPRAFLQRMLRDLKDAHGRPEDAGRRLFVVQYLRLHPLRQPLAPFSSPVHTRTTITAIIAATCCRHRQRYEQAGSG